MKIKRFFDQKDSIAPGGAAIVVDILRAATVEAFVLARGASCIFPVATTSEAFALKEKNPSFILMGEENGYPVRGFDFGNSPSAVENVDFSGKIIVHRTSNGTRQLQLARANTLLLGSLNTISSTYEYIVKSGETSVGLIGAEVEDNIFFDAFESLSHGESLSKADLQQQLFSHAKNSYFWDETKPEFPQKDVYLAAEIDLFHFCCVVKKENGRLMTRKVVPSV